MKYISEIDQLAAYPSIDTDVLRTFVAIADQAVLPVPVSRSTAPNRRSACR